MRVKILNDIESTLRGVVWALALSAATTVVMLALEHFTGLGHGSVVYLIAVVVAAIRWGLVSAVTAAIAGVMASAFFFYAPVWSIHVQEPQQVIDLALFIFVAIVTSHLAAQLSEARVQAAAEPFRQALIDSVSHELRTPLASILGAATVLQAAPAIAADARLRDLTGIVRSEAERLNDDIGNLLDASRISRDGIHPRLEWADPADIVNAAVERAQARLGRHRVALRVAGDLPLVRIDAVLVRQALIQVLDNAAKYSPADSTIAVDVSPAAGMVRIAARDNGAGLTAEEKDRLWHRFYRGERNAAAVGGSGLGLWIAKSFVSATGGSIAADSNGPGQGTTVTIELPAPPDRHPGETKDETDG